MSIASYAETLASHVWTSARVSDDIASLVLKSGEAPHSSVRLWRLKTAGIVAEDATRNDNLRMQQARPRQ
jgi:hypothetical protein